MPLPIKDFTNPHVINFLKDVYDKNIRTRMRWNQQHGERVKTAATLQREEKGYKDVDVLKAAIEGEISSLSREHGDACRNKKLKPIRDAIFVPGVKHLRKEHSIIKVGLGDATQDKRLVRPDTDLSFDPIMRPIEVEVKQMLHKDIPYFGRMVYLKNRMKKSPEEKYYLRESMGWECGWRLKDSYFNKPTRKLGKFSHLMHDRSITGPQPDPAHYISPDEPGVSKCVANV